MERPTGGLNALDVAGERMLLVETGGPAVHLAAETGAGKGRPAVPLPWLRPDGPGYVASVTNYLLQELEAARWSPHSLCGREWTAMAAGDAGPLYRDQPIQHAPTCRRCLAILDRRFPAPRPDERIGSVVELAARAVQAHGSAEIIGVPGDQVTPLRAGLRRAFRRRFGHAGKTWLVNDLLLVTCDQATEEVRLAKRREVVRSLYKGAPTTVRDDSGWRIHWHTWA